MIIEDGKVPLRFQEDEIHSVSAPLRLRGGVDTTNECQENMVNFETQTDSVLADDLSISSPSDHDTQYVVNENESISTSN